MTDVCKNKPGKGKDNLKTHYRKAEIYPSISRGQKIECSSQLCHTTCRSRKG